MGLSVMARLVSGRSTGLCRKCMASRILVGVVTRLDPRPAQGSWKEVAQLPQVGRKLPTYCLPMTGSVPDIRIVRVAIAMADNKEETGYSASDGSLVALIADEDTCTGFLLAGVGNIDMRKKSNFLVVDSKTSTKAIETAFKEFTAREDVSIVLISQTVANMIRNVVDQHNKAVPAVLEIPSKDNPYDPAQDSVLNRVKHIFGFEGGKAPGSTARLSEIPSGWKQVSQGSEYRRGERYHTPAWRLQALATRSRSKPPNTTSSYLELCVVTNANPCTGISRWLCLAYMDAFA
eukprot:gene4904-34671_t